MLNADATLSDERALEEAQWLLDEANQPDMYQYYFQEFQNGFGITSASGSPSEEERLVPGLGQDDPSKTDTASA